MKICIDCRKEKELSFFGKRKNISKTKTIWYCSACKSCMVKRTNKWKEKNIEKHKKYQREWHKNNRKKI